MIQIITPNPNIRCEPGWCLQYVRQSFGLPARYGTATEAWEKSPSQHRDRNFPAGVWVPVWYGLDKEPAGHVVLLAPDGSVYSTSDYSNTAHHHPNLADLENYYARYGMALTYRGWTEDVAGYPVLGSDGINFQSITTTAQEWDEMASKEEIKEAFKEVAKEGQAGRDLAWFTWRESPLPGWNGDVSAAARIAGTDQAVNDIRGQVVGLTELVKQLSVKQGVVIDYDAVAKAVNDDAAKRMAK
jgi:hypothetical protein